MNQIKNKADFLAWLTESNKEYQKKRFERTHYRSEKELLILGGLEVLNIEIHDKHFACTEFRNCTFENCEFSSSVFLSCTLENCRFVDCKFSSSKFLDSDLNKCQFEACTIYDLEFSDVHLNDVLFINCGEILDFKIRSWYKRKIIFVCCYLHYLDIEPLRESIEAEEFVFNDCLIHESSFDRINLTKSVFSNCNLSLNQFSACEFSSNTFQDKNEISGSEFNLIDIRSILNSQPLNLEILEKLFGIRNSDVKDYLVGLTSKIEFQSIFISYSFKDENFAKVINDELIKRGIITFLWEKDSLGGKPLKGIMTEGVRNKDRVLFIASANSLKSQACHFELTEGRKKQEETWEDVLFPIHIDNYLFEITKDKIRPKEKQDEYWTNIEELKDLNSLSFCDYKEHKNRQNSLFEKQLLRLIKGLRKEK